MMWKFAVGAVGALLAGVWAFNSSTIQALITDVGDNRPKVLSHRGVHQTFHRVGLTNKTCTAERIDAPTHGFLENTIPSMRAAFEAGAEIVEIDVYLTADQRWAVFHDWTIDCRTEGEGVIRTKTLAALKELDIGYGYTADDGKSHPFRGAGVGLMPELHDVFEAFPDGQFLINFKSNDPAEGKKFAADLVAHPDWRQRVWGVYGSPKSVAAALEADGALSGYSKPSLFACVKEYAVLGWSGHVPDSCANTKLAIPSNYGPWLWGWPHKFTARMKAAGTEVILMGPYKKGDPGTVGIDDSEALTRVPEHFDGYVWTNKVQELAPLLAARSR